MASMTNNQKMKDIICRYIDGEAYASIGKTYGVTRQAVEQLIKTFATSILTERRNKAAATGTKKAKQYVRTNLANWLKENKIPASRFAEKIGVTQSFMSAFLLGKCNLSYKNLSAVSQFTGLTIEQIVEMPEEQPVPVTLHNARAMNW